MGVHLVIFWWPTHSRDPAHNEPWFKSGAYKRQCSDGRRCSQPVKLEEGWANVVSCSGDICIWRQSITFETLAQASYDDMTTSASDYLLGRREGGDEWTN